MIVFNYLLLIIEEELTLQEDAPFCPQSMCVPAWETGPWGNQSQLLSRAPSTHLLLLEILQINPKQIPPWKCGQVFIFWLTVP